MEQFYSHKKIVSLVMVCGIVLLNIPAGIAAEQNSAPAKPATVTTASDAKKMNAPGAKSSVLTKQVPSATQRPAPSSVSGSLATGTTQKEVRSVKEDYLIQPGDRIRIKVYPEDEYIKGSDMQVGSDGNITLPLVGKTGVAGKTIREAESDMAKVINEDYIVNPEVVIEVLEYGHKAKSIVIILGQVRKPGSYEFPPDKDHVTLLEIISMAGGFSEVANIKKIKIIRKQNGKKDVISANAESIISGDEPDIELRTGDVVNVAESLF